MLKQLTSEAAAWALKGEGGRKGNSRGLDASYRCDTRSKLFWAACFAIVAYAAVARRMRVSASGKIPWPM